VQQAGDRLQRGGLAGAVGAQQRGDPSWPAPSETPLSTRITPSYTTSTLFNVSILGP